MNIKKKRNKWAELEVEFFAHLWLFSWFLMIWFKDYRFELFFTGLFAFILVNLMNKIMNKKINKEYEAKIKEIKKLQDKIDKLTD